MVLMIPGLKKYRSTVWAVLAALSASACRTMDVRESAPSAARSLALAWVADDVEHKTALVPSSSVVDAVTSALNKDNLSVRVVETRGLPSLRRSPSTHERLIRLEGETAEDIVVLVETAAQFDVQLGGRFRWDWRGRVAAARRGRLDAAVEREFHRPVFLDFDHQGAAQVLQYGVRTLQSEVVEAVRALDDGAGLDPPSAPAGQPANR